MCTSSSASMIHKEMQMGGVEDRDRMKDTEMQEKSAANLKQKQMKSKASEATRKQMLEIMTTMNPTTKRICAAVKRERIIVEAG